MMKQSNENDFVMIEGERYRIVSIAEAIAREEDAKFLKMTRDAMKQRYQPMRSAFSVGCHVTAKPKAEIERRARLMISFPLLRYLTAA